MSLAGKAQISRNDRCGSVCISEEALAFFDFFVAYKSSQRNACFLRKSAGQVLTAQEQMVSDLFGYTTEDLVTRRALGSVTSDQLLFGDTHDWGAGYDSGLYSGQFTSQQYYVSVWNGNFPDKVATSSRHSRGGNFAWMDGHVDWRKPSEMLGVNNAKWAEYNRALYYFAIRPLN